MGTKQVVETCFHCLIRKYWLLQLSDDLSPPPPPWFQGQDAFMNAVVKTENCLPWDISTTNVAATSPLDQTSTYAMSPSSLSPDSLSSLSSDSLLPDSLSTSSLSPTSPAGQTLIFIPQDESDELASHLALPSDLSQFPGSILPPSSSSSTIVTSSSSPSLTLSPTSFSTSMPIQLNSILNQKIQIRPKPNNASSAMVTNMSGNVVTTVPVSVNGGTNLAVNQIMPKMGLKPVSVKPGEWFLTLGEKKEKSLDSV